MQSEVRPARHRAPELLPPSAQGTRGRRLRKEPRAPEAQPFCLLTVSSSSVVTSADKSTVALVLKTEEAGPVAFQITIEACAVLRCQIAIAETILNPKKARSDRQPATPAIEPHSRPPQD
jgi:hypothetical protein